MGQLLDGIIRGIVDKQTEIYNPVFLYGTPLNTIEAIEKLVELYSNTQPQAVINHVVGEHFTISLVRAIKEDRLEQYTKSLSACDLFILEGAEHLGGKMMTMKEFYGIFDKLWESGKQIVITGLTTPIKMACLEPRIRTQLEGGIIYNVDENF